MTTPRPQARVVSGHGHDRPGRSAAPADRMAGADQERLSKIFHHSANAIAFTVAPLGQIVDVNETWLQLSGFRREDVIGKTGRDLGLWASPAHREDCLAQLQATGRVRDFETLLVLNGRERPCLLSACSIAMREADYIMWEVRDITELKRVQAAQEELRAQLLQAQKMEAIGRLSGGIAHDFNNILTAILGNVGLLGDHSRLSTAARESLAEIKDGADRAIALTRQLLAFSRGQPLQPVDLDLNTTVAAMGRLLHRLLGEDIRMELRCAAEPLVVRADVGMIEQVVMNLAVNARDAMPCGGLLLIETAAVSAGEVPARRATPAPQGSYVRLSVTDNGCGITADALPRIFEPFFSTKEVGKGTGLGLATVFGIVQQHDGWVDVETQLGHGTIFHVYLPRLARTEVAPARRRPSLNLPRGTETILVVEDESSLRTLARRLLTKLGYTVHEASSGAKALEVWELHQDQIGLVLTDMVMPDGISGRELSERLRRRKPGLRVICTSGYSADMAGREVVRQAGVRFLPKPFEAAELAQLVRELLDEPPAG